MSEEQQWLQDHRASRPYPQPGTKWDNPSMWKNAPYYSRNALDELADPITRDIAFNRHSMNDGSHVSPFDEGRIDVGLDNLQVRLLQGINEDAFKLFLSRSLRATTGIHPDEPPTETDWDEMMRGGLQSALETQTIIFEVTGASRALTHQLVRSRKAGFHQQSQRATWFGDKPNFRMPHSVFVETERRAEPSSVPHMLKNVQPSVRDTWDTALKACWAAYKAACDAGISYQDARYILPEGTTNYILCEYTVREFINVFAYRGCSMFLWEMVGAMREMRRVLLEANPFLEPYVKISCEKGGLCVGCRGSGFIWEDGVPADTSEVRNYYKAPESERSNIEIRQCVTCGGLGSNQRKCTFQGWESVEEQCDFPWAKQSNRVFLPKPKYRIEKG